MADPDDDRGEPGGDPAADSGGDLAPGAVGPGIGSRHRHARHGSRRRRPGDRGPWAVLLFTVLGTLVPGLGLIVAGWRRVGSVVLAVVALALAAVGIRFATDPIATAGSALDDATLTALAVGALVIGVAWAVLVVCTYRALRPPVDSALHRGAMATVVGVLCVLVLAPTAVASSLANTTRRTVDAIFVGGPSATVDRSRAPGTVADPWRDKPRLNVLLLGGDAGPTRAGGIRSGLRTDTMVVASIDTHTGNTVLISVARNVQRLQFAPGTPLGEAYPDGYVSAPSQNLLNSVYDDVPAAHPGILGESAHEGADALKKGLEYSLGLGTIDYYVLVSTGGFSRVVDALGGLTVDVNQPVADGGEFEAGVKNILPRRWIMPGPQQHLSGRDTEWFARGRYGTDDYERIRRQRCTINAITAQATPAKVLAGYESLASTARDVTETDIPKAALPALLGLGDTVKRTGTRSSVTIDDRSNIPGFSQTRPDWDEVRTVVRSAIARSEAQGTRAPTTPPATGATTAPSSTPGPTPSPTPTRTRRPTATPSIADDLDATCAWDPVAADRALRAWQATYGGRFDDEGNRR